MIKSRQGRKNRITTLIRLGETAAYAGQRAEARRHFRTALTLDPTNVPALLWLAWLNDDPRASLAYVDRALDYNPTNPRAQAAQEWVQRRITDLNPQEPPSTPTVHQAILTKVTGLSLFWIILSLVVIFVGATIAWPLLENVPVSAALAPNTQTTATATETVTTTSTPTHPPSPTPSSTPRPTHTPTSSPTPSPTLTLTPTTSPILPTAPPLPPSLTPAPLTVSSGGVRWIDVDLTHQLLTAYEGQRLVRVTSVSTGLPHTPTPTGQYHIWIKLRYDDMSGPDYYLSNVPYVMYFHGGYGLHGTTWHGNFGQPMSHGCVNLPTSEAEWLFNWAQVGTMVNIHH
ncbi:MAG: L,D-transpeptidase family protein [Chloroflexi bacterium]|nr:L,D-transpeptidase family protein [Chloroflexota bacterium]